MRRQMIAAAVLVCGVWVATAHAFPAGAPDDHFLCYKAKTTKNTPAFALVSNVSLVDGLVPTNFDVKKSMQLCNAASTGSPIIDSVTHLESYKIKAVSGSAKHVAQTNVHVVNELGELYVDTKKPDLLLVPTAIDTMGGTPSAPNPLTHNVDHYECYSVKVTKGQPKFPKGLQRTVGDQAPFTSPAKVFDIKKPKHLCYPVDQNGGGIKHATGFLMCYQVKPASGQAKHTPVLNFKAANEFNQPETRDTQKEAELCVRSVINPVCGDNAINQASEQCDGSDDALCPGNCSSLCQCRQSFPFVLDPDNSEIDVRGVGVSGAGIDNDFTFPGLAGTFIVNIDGVITPGQYQISVPVTSFPPLNVTILAFGNVATACVSLTEDPTLPGSGISGIGVLNCFGTPVVSIASPDFSVHLDHCTNGTACDSGAPGQCTGELGAGGKLHTLTGICVPAAPEDAACTAADAKLESALNSDPHDGVCNSPIFGVPGTASWNPGDAVLSLNAAIDIRPPNDDCSGASAIASVKGVLTTGTAISTIMDAFPSSPPAAGKVQAISITGAHFGCIDPLPAPPGAPIAGTSGVVLGTSVAVLDVPLPSPFGLADLNTVLKLQAQ